MIGPRTLRAVFRWQNADHGTAALEFAIAAPMLLILLLGMIEVGMSTYEGMQVQNAAEAGAMFAARDPTNIAGISAAVTGASGTAGIAATPAPAQFCGCPTVTGITVGNCTTACTGGTAQSRYLRVSAERTHTPIVTFPGLPNPMVLKASSIVRVQ